MKLYSIEVQGKTKTWSFNAYLDEKYIDEWLDDGLQIYEVVNTVPDWVPARLHRVWFFFQDIWHFKNPFSSKEDADLHDE